MGNAAAVKSRIKYAKPEWPSNKLETSCAIYLCQWTSESYKCYNEPILSGSMEVGHEQSADWCRFH